MLDGGAGNDSLTGTSNDDRLTGGPGADTITGGLGTDTIVEVRDASFTLTNTRLTSGTEVDTLSSIERGELTGGDSANTLNASTFTGPVVLDGGAGNDTLTGGSGNDTLTGGPGIDNIDGRGGTNTLVESGNTRFVLTNTTLDMAEGPNETATITLTGVSDGYFTLTFDGQTTQSIPYDSDAWKVRAILIMLPNVGADNVQVSGTADAWTVTFTNTLGGKDIVPNLQATGYFTSGSVAVAVTNGQVRTNTLAHIQIAHLTGGFGDNLMDASAFSGSVVLDGDAGNDTLIGSAGNDTLIGGWGDDRIAGGLGTDTIDGGKGTDTVVDSRNANFTLTNTLLTIGSESNTLANIEQAELTGGASNNTMNASAFTGLNADTWLTLLNSGVGVRTIAGKSDLRITLSDGTNVDVDLSPAHTLQDIFDIIAAANEHLSMSLNAAATALVITDTTGGASNITVTALNGSSAASGSGHSRHGHDDLLDRHDPLRRQGHARWRGRQRYADRHRW